jgi:hypothetical protein
VLGDDTVMEARRAREQEPAVAPGGAGDDPTRVDADHVQAAFECGQYGAQTRPAEADDAQIGGQVAGRGRRWWAPAARASPTAVDRGY